MQHVMYVFPVRLFVIVQLEKGTVPLELLAEMFQNGVAPNRPLLVELAGQNEFLLDEKIERRLIGHEHLSRFHPLARPPQ